MDDFEKVNSQSEASRSREHDKLEGQRFARILKRIGYSLYVLGIVGIVCEKYLPGGMGLVASVLFAGWLVVRVGRLLERLPDDVA